MNNYTGYEARAYSEGAKCAIANQNQDAGAARLCREMLAKLRPLCPTAQARFDEGYKSEAKDLTPYKYCR
jgi:hypothetical protein